MEIKRLEGIIEAILFTMGESVEVDRIANAIEHDVPTTKKIIRNMMDRYQEEDRGIRIIELEDSFQMCTKPEVYEYLIRIAKQPKRHVLTDVMLETLSIIAYKQPVTRLEIEKIRGVKSDHAINKLIVQSGMRGRQTGCTGKTASFWYYRRIFKTVQRAVAGRASGSRCREDGSIQRRSRRRSTIKTGYLEA